MARIEKMHPISIKCGIFRKHTEQLSWNIDNYYEELKKIINIKKIILDL